MKDTTKQRADTALTLEIAGAIVERLKAGEPITRRGSKDLLLDYLPGQEKVSVSTYTSWLRRGTVPVGSTDGITLKDLVEAAREAFRKEFQRDMLRRAERVVSETLDMPISQPVVLKRTNAEGKIESYTSERIDPRLAEVRLRAAEFALRKLDARTYGDSTQIQLQSPFSLSDLRRAKEQRDELLHTTQG